MDTYTLEINDIVADWVERWNALSDQLRSFQLNNGNAAEYLELQRERQIIETSLGTYILLEIRSCPF